MLNRISCEQKNGKLTAMETIRNSLKVDVGYSDHTEGIEIAIAAAALGARIIEKHITLDKGLMGLTIRQVQNQSYSKK